MEAASALRITKIETAIYAVSTVFLVTNTGTLPTRCVDHTQVVMNTAWRIVVQKTHRAISRLHVALAHFAAVGAGRTIFVALATATDERVLAAAWRRTSRQQTFVNRTDTSIITKRVISRVAAGFVELTLVLSTLDSVVAQ